MPSRGRCLASKPGDGAAADLAVVARRVPPPRGRVLVFSVACFPPINHEICLFGSTGTVLGLVVLRRPSVVALYILLSLSLVSSKTINSVRTA